MSAQSKDSSFLAALSAEAEKYLVEDSARPLIRMAAFFAEVNLRDLVEDTKAIFNYRPTISDVKYFIASSDFIRKRKIYILDDFKRTQILEKLSLREIRETASRISHQHETPVQSVYRMLLQGNLPDPATMSTSELVALFNTSAWLLYTAVPTPDRKIIRRLISRHELLIPFENLTRNFEGRKNELITLENYFNLHRPNHQILRFFQGRAKGSPSATNEMQAPLLITGIGGSGKSTLIGKAILNQQVKSPSKHIPFVYIDFDNPGFSISNIMSLVREALRQLSVQFDAFERYFAQATAVIDTEYYKTGSDDSRASDRTYLLDEIFSSEIREIVHAVEHPVIIVFDSFEELQYRVKSTQIFTLFNFLHQLWQYVPQIRPVFVGRSDLDFPGMQFTKIELEGFDDDCALAFLKKQGLMDAQLQQMIIKKIGCNPLRLRLAANFANAAQAGGHLSLTELYEKLENVITVEELVLRNLDHIRSNDQRVRQIAIPGILVRRLNPDVIKNVLAVPCGLGGIDDATARDLFSELENETFLFNYYGDEISFRQDLRMALAPLINRGEKYRDRARAVHESAIRFYSNARDPYARAEHLYHLVMSGADVRTIAGLYDKSLQEYLEKSIIEFPVKAYVYFANVLQLSIPPEKLVELDTEDWELYMKGQAETIFASGDYVQLQALGQQFDQRSDRSPLAIGAGTEAVVKCRLRRTADARAVVGKALGSKEISSLERLELVVQQAEIEEYESNFANAWKILHEYESRFLQVVEKNESADYLKMIRVLLRYVFTWQRTKHRVQAQADRDDFVDQIHYLLNSLTSVTNTSASDFFSLLPKPYDFVFRQHFLTGRETQRAGDLGEMLQFFRTEFRTFASRIQPQKEFSELRTRLKKDFGEIPEIERYLRRNFDVYLKDITYPGEPSILFEDAARFIEVHPRSEFAKVYTKTPGSSHPRGLNTDDFFLHNNVNRCLDRLKQLTTNREFIVSDVVDAKGHQYVNALLQAGGVDVFSVLGYVYILEQMGIRFLEVAGSGTGAALAAFHSAAGTNDQAKTKQALESMLRADWPGFIDGSLLAKRLLRASVTGHGLATLKSLAFTSIALVVLFAAASVLSFVYDLHNAWKYILTGYSVILVGLFVAAITWCMQTLRRINRGLGLNPGTVIRNWVSDEMNTYGTRSAEQFRANGRVPDLSSRNPSQAKPNIPDFPLNIICAEQSTERVMIFPRMCPLFQKIDPFKQTNAADIVMMALSVPVLFPAYRIDGIPDDPGMQLLWKEHVELSRVPAAAYFTAYGLQYESDDVFEVNNGAVPDFSVRVGRSEPIVSRYIDTEYLSNFLLRLMSRKELFPGGHRRRRSSRAAHCEITSFIVNAFDYWLSSAQKIELFVQGAEAATEFLLGFDWEEYKRTRNNLV